MIERLNAEQVEQLRWNVSQFTTGYRALNSGLAGRWSHFERAIGELAALTDEELAERRQTMDEFLLESGVVRRSDRTNNGQYYEQEYAMVRIPRLACSLVAGEVGYHSPEVAKVLMELKMIPELVQG